MLPLLLIYQGKTNRSLPKEEVRQEAEKEGHAFVTTKNHWMVVDSAKKYVQLIVEPQNKKMVVSFDLNQPSREVTFINVSSKPN